MDQGSIDDMFSQMLGELDDLTQQLDAVPDVPVTKSSTLPLAAYESPQPPPPSSTVTDFDEEDVDLTAMLSDLSTFEENINEPANDRNGYSSSQNSWNNRSEEDHSFGNGFQEQIQSHRAPPPPVGPSPPPVAKKPLYSTSQYSSMERRESEDITLEALSKDIDLEQHHQTKELTEHEFSQLSPEEREERMKSEKMKIALEKMKEARIQKLVVKVFNKDDSSKTMVIDERMTTRHVMKQLIEKNHFDFSPNWALIEEMPDMFLERVYEEHEKPCETMKFWTRDTTNQIRFLERKDKYALFKNPQHYLLSASDQQEQMQERQKQILIEEFFSGKGPSSGVPEVEGFLHIKNGKSWSRKYCVLRSSGLYISKSGEPKRGKKLNDLTCFVMFEQAYLYVGRGWKKKFKAPYEYGFALKHPAIQMKSKHVRYLACEDFKSLMRWSVGIRLAKYGKQLLENYQKTTEEMKASSSLTLPYKHEQTGDNISIKSSGSSDGGSRSNTLPRPNMGVKNIFEGAWQRAHQSEKNDQPTEVSLQVGSMSRGKSVWRPNPKKTNNWWDLQDDVQSQDSLPSVIDSDSTSTSRSMDDVTGTSQFIPPPPVNSGLPPPPDPGDAFPLPPPIDDMPPPPMAMTSYNLTPSRKGPPPPPKPTSGTFTSFDDPLPPPPPLLHAGNNPRAGSKVPPPVPMKKPSHHHNWSNNNSTPVSSLDSLPLPPAPATNPTPTIYASPLSSYYMEGNAVYGKDDFPPPPPFIADLQESFEAVSQPSTGEKSLDRPPPKPKSLISYIKSQTLSRLQGRNKKKCPALPTRSVHTRLSFSQR